MDAVNKISLKQKFINYKNHPGSLIMLLITWLAALLTAAVVVFLVAYILIKGVPNIKPSLFAWKYNSENVSMMPAIINTVIMTALSLLLAAPIGIFSAVYLTEYAKRGNTLVKVVRVTTETLAGIPSIVYGLFGYLIFVIACHFHQSMLSGALTLAIMILPTMMRTTEEALLGVPDTYREGSFGLGAGDYARSSRWCCPPPCREYSRALYCRSAELWAKRRRLYTPRARLPEYPRI